MRILLVAGRLTYSNKTTYTLQLTRGLISRGHKVQVASLGGALLPQIEEMGAMSYLVKFNYFSFRRLLSYLREFDPELIHATGGPRALYAAHRVSRALGTPLVHTVHSWLEEDRGTELPRALHGIIAVNEDLRQHLVHEKNVPKGRIRVIPYGVDVPDEATSRTGQPDRPVVGTIGRLDPGRRYDEFLEAAALIRQRAPDALFILAGEGPDEARLHRRAKGLGLGDVMTFVQPRGDPGAIFSVMDVLVVVSDWGGVGLTLLEGMAHDRAVVATGGGEVLSVLDEQESCVLIPPGDAKRLADEVVELLEDPARRAELGYNARRHVKRHFPVGDLVGKVQDFYQHILTSSGS